MDRDENFLKESNQICSICCDKKANAILMKCGHGGVCYDCAISMWQSTGECPLCRKEIIEIYQIKEDQNKSRYYEVVASTKRIKIYETDKEKKIEVSEEISESVS